MKTQHLFLIMVVFVSGVFGYAILVPHDKERTASAVGPSESASASPTGPPPVYDVSHLIAPEDDYLGVALSGAPQDMSRVDAWAKQVGHKPNIITIYESFDDGFAAAEVRKVYQYGALPIVRWEPFKQKLSDIAKGDHDPYLIEFAQAVRTLNLPIALTIAHEMNGDWYPWGHDKNKPADFVAAWKHIHGVFAAAGATNVIWTWTPNVINPVPQVKLKPLYPGDAYVDWVGLDGYFTRKGEKTYADLFTPTITSIRAFTQKKILIVETGSEPGSMRAKAIDSLFAAVAKAPDVIGFVYFNQKGSGDWVLDTDTPALAAYRAHAARDGFGFTVR